MCAASAICGAPAHPSREPKKISRLQLAELGIRRILSCSPVNNLVRMTGEQNALYLASRLGCKIKKHASNIYIYISCWARHEISVTCRVMHGWRTTHNYDIILPKGSLLPRVMIQYIYGLPCENYFWKHRDVKGIYPQLPREGNLCIIWR